VRCDHRIEEPDLSKGGVAIDRAHGHSVQICVSRGRQGASLFPVSKEDSRFVWTRECEEAFLKLKEYLVSPLVLCKS